ncbi:MAG: CDP-alcohol phosphatidyltransferase family protein [Bradymonadia bacterium]
MKKRTVIPYALTLGNLLCGVLAMGVVASGWPLWQAGAFVGLGLLFDLFDGRTARALDVDGPMGAQLDSLADVVTFGVAPAFTLHAWKLHEAGPIGLIAAGLLIAAAATRLARFNVDAGAPKVVEGPAQFSGLAVTIPALITLGAAAADVSIHPVMLSACAIVLAGLMVSTLPYRSFKDRSVLLIVGPSAVLLALGVLWTGSLATGLGLTAALGGTVYALSGPLCALWRRPPCAA